MFNSTVDFSSWSQRFEKVPSSFLLSTTGGSTHSYFSSSSGSTICIIQEELKMTNPVFLLLFWFFLTCLGMAENTTLVPVNVGVVLDLDTWFGKMGLSCINMALSDFYASHSNYNTRLVLHPRNSTGDVVVAATAAQDLINNVKVQAIIGPQSSMEANFVIRLGEKAQVPIISFSATSPSLKGSYFIRIAQSDSSQVVAIINIIQAFGWKKAVPISVGNEFGEGVIPYLITALQAVDVRIPYWSVIPSTATTEQISVELHKLNSMETRVFIVHMLPSLGSPFFAKAREIGMMDQGYVWIMTNGMTNSFSSSSSSVDIENMQGVLGLKTYIPSTKELEYFRARWQRKFQQDNPTILDIKLDVYGLWAHDAAWALAMAVEKVSVSQGGLKLVQELSRTRFTGLSGDFSLIDGQPQSSAFQIVNVNENGGRGIGYWTPENGLVRDINSKNKTTKFSTSNASLGPIIWPGETISAPMGWQIPMNGTSLKILVPVLKVFQELVTVRYEPGSKSNVTGYCIDVFKAVMEALPYHVPYEFYPFATPDGKMAGSYSDLLDQVFLGKYDGAVGDISIRANRSLYVDFTLPFTESGVSVVVPIKSINGAKNAWVFLQPLTWDLWVTSGCFFIFIGFVVWFLEHRINEDFQGTARHQIGTSFWFSFSTMVFAHREVVGSWARFVVIIWCFVVLILTQSYTASLTSILTVQQLQPIVTDVNSLIRNGDNVGYQQNSFVYVILKQAGFQNGNLKAYTSTQDLDKLFREGNGNGGISAAFGETPYMRLFLATYCSNYTIVEPTFKADGFAFVFQKGSLLTRDVSTEITYLHEGAEMKAIEEKWLKKNVSCLNLENADSSNSHTLSLDSFRGLFVLASGASSLALLICSATFLYQHRNILTQVDSQDSSFAARIRKIVSAYYQVDGKAADEVSASPSNSVSPVEPDIVPDELPTPNSTEIGGDSSPNGQATQETEDVRQTA